jgi:hypothetical protein
MGDSIFVSNNHSTNPQIFSHKKLITFNPGSVLYEVLVDALLGFHGSTFSEGKKSI